MTEPKDLELTQLQLLTPRDAASDAKSGTDTMFTRWDSLEKKALDNDQPKALVESERLCDSEADPQDSMMIDKPEELRNANSPSENFALARSVTLERRDYNRMTREEIVRAKDIVLAAQRRRVEQLERKIRDLEIRLHAADRVQTLTMDVLNLSLDQDCQC
ncbi:hypothetical protein BKA70DRAFT_1232285 [Coprinopsis sp. MPI-PUGE-AT-0042]|nr:hypothetical protein BKA70DRAFT_1232285 [Coprinopsis sp. MPI-PUGE-AT-0042]